jgi:integrase
MPVRFYLHTKTYADGRRPIYADIRWGKGSAATAQGEARLRTGTGQSCLPKHFTDSGRLASGAKGYLAANRALAQLETDAETHIGRAELEGTELTPEQLLTLLKPKRKIKGAPALPDEPAAPAVRTMAVVFADWQQARRARLSPKTLSNPTGLLQRLEEFRPGLRPEDFTPDAAGRCRLLDDFCTYLVEDAPLRTGRTGLFNNTVSSYLKALRKLLRHAGQDVSWLVDEYAEETEGEPLTYEEVLRLYQTPVLELKSDHHAIKPRVHVRDVFVFNCLTGPRYTNLAGLKPSDVRMELVDGQQVPVLQYVQHKRKRNLAPVRVALSPIAYEIWQRYDGQLPVPTNQTMNGVIKQLARAAGLKREVTIVRGNGPRRVEQALPFWKAITCHTARHSFVTLQHEGGSDLVTIQESVGHSNINMTRRYLKSRPTARHTATLAAFAQLDKQASEATALGSAE